MELKIISGGQTGADLGGLWAAKLFGLPTGGQAPSNFQTLNGPQPGLGSTFGLTAAGTYPVRTVKNVRAADLTLVFSRDMRSRGTQLTINSCLKLKRDYVPIPDDRRLHETLESYWGIGKGVKVASEIVSKIKRKMLLDDSCIVNVAGNATQNAHQSFEFAFMGMFTVLTYLAGSDMIRMPEYMLKSNFNAGWAAHALKDHFNLSEVDPSVQQMLNVTPEDYNG